MWVVGALLIGAFWWTFLEYVLHRFAFHQKGRIFGKRHLAHHAHLEKRRLAIAPWQSMLVGALINAGVMIALCGPVIGGTIFAGFMAGYAAYEWVHYSTHYRVARTGIGRYLRAYHLAHHHKSPKARFGVTSPLWDLVFGTYQPVARGAGRSTAA